MTTSIVDGNDSVYIYCYKAIVVLIRKELKVEVCLHDTSSSNENEIKTAVENVLQQQQQHIIEEGPIQPAIWATNSTFLRENIKYIRICTTPSTNTPVRYRIFIYQLNPDETIEDIETIGDEEIITNQQWILPLFSLDSLWESLIFDSTLKENLLKYVMTSLLMSQANVNVHLISWNRVVLLHGPPGTGKTSLCRALAQKISVRLSASYSTFYLVEVNGHSLFSKWFSESGKLVMKMFSKVKLLLEDPETFVCLLIDEVESLAAARNAAMNGSDPSDAIRVVNALLTQLDQLKMFPNVIILTTSNITGAIDLAFVDRADIKQYIGPPSPPAVYHILSSCIIELQRTNIIVDSCVLLSYRWIEQMNQVQLDTQALTLSRKLYLICHKCQNFSGRKLRKLPFLALALEVQDSQCDLSSFLRGLENIVDKELTNKI